MRHRRLKQCVTYKYGNNRDSKYIHQDKKSLAIKFAKQLGESISTMKAGKLYFESEGILDPTFKWCRNAGMQFVTWKTEDEMKAFRGDNLVYVKTYK